MGPKPRGINPSTWITALLVLSLLSVATMTAVQAEDFVALDIALPRGGNTEKYAPVFDFDFDGCLPSAGISREGQKNSGEDHTLNNTYNCRGIGPNQEFLPTSNTLHRYARITSGGSDYCAHF